MATTSPHVTGKTARTLSLAKQVAAAGGVAAWNDRTAVSARQWRMADEMCKATTVQEALAEVGALLALEHKIWAYIYFRTLHNRNIDLYYALLLSAPRRFMPIAYTPTVGEACQRFGNMPHFARGCYVCIEDRGNFRKVLLDYAAAHLELNPDGSGKYLCDCVVFSDGGRILGLGDLGAWGMGIPIGKLDLYTICGGVNPHRTMPVIIDAGCYDKTGNTAHLNIRGSPNYTGCKLDRVVGTSAAGTTINKAYYGKGNIIDEFMTAACDVFGDRVLLQFEDFNSNDAFPLLENTRHRYLTYNDDIQGTAAVTVAGIFGALKLKYPDETNLLDRIKKEKILLFGSGSANLGAASLLTGAGGVPKENLVLTGSRGVIWKTADGSSGCYRNDEQKFFAVSPEPTWPHTKLIDIVNNVKPSILVGAAGRAPGAFDKDVIEAMVKSCAGSKSKRPVIFALSNPTTQAECNSAAAYEVSKGLAIFGSGTGMAAVTVGGREHQPGMVNNVYIFPAMSFAAIHCHAKEITDRLFLVAAQAVANSLDKEDMKFDRVMPSLDRIRDVAHNVATAVILACQEDGLAQTHCGVGWDAVHASVGKAMWAPKLAPQKLQATL